MSEYMTTEEVADLLRTKIETVRYWRHIKYGPKSFKAGRRVLYAREDVEAFIESLRSGQTEPEPGQVTEEHEERPVLSNEEAVRVDERRKIAAAIVKAGSCEGPRAQRIIRMCAGLASHPEFR